MAVYSKMRIVAIWKLEGTDEDSGDVPIMMCFASWAVDIQRRGYRSISKIKIERKHDDSTLEYSDVSLLNMS